MSYSTIIKYIPEEYTQYLIQYHKENKHNYDIFDWEEDDLFLQMWGLTEKSKISGRYGATNWQFNHAMDDPLARSSAGVLSIEGEVYDKCEIEMNLIVKKILDLFNVEYTEFEAFIKTSYLPISLHVDANRYEGPTTSHNNWDGKVPSQRQDGSDSKQGISIIIPLTFNKDIHTIIFKNIAEDNDYVQDFQDVVSGLYEETNPKEHQALTRAIGGHDRANLPTYEHNLDYRDYIPNIWNKQMIEFYLDPENKPYARGDQILDYLEVDVIIPWEDNVAYLFDKQRMHMSNNFKKFGVESKDFLLIHTH